MVQWLSQSTREISESNIDQDSFRCSVFCTFVDILPYRGKETGASHSFLQDSRIATTDVFETIGVPGIVLEVFDKHPVVDTGDRTEPKVLAGLRTAAAESRKEVVVMRMDTD